MKHSNKITIADIPRVGRGTPAGTWFRRYWMVVGTTRDLYDIPQAVRVLGEELVLFRDPAGEVGLLGAHCPHRGASLEYGDIEDGGIRCAYHGWLFDVRGRCLAMPAEPKQNNFSGKVKHLSYPVREQGGLLFAYFGPQPESPPPLPKYKTLADEAGQRSLEATRVYNYNWVTSSKTAPTRCIFQLYIAPIRTMGRGGAGPSIIARFLTSMQSKPNTA